VAAQCRTPLTPLLLSSAMSADWPESCACLYRDALPAATLAAVAADSDAMAAVAPNFWVPREAIEGAAEAREPRTLAEQVVCELYDRVLVRPTVLVLLQLLHATLSRRTALHGAEGQACR